MTNLFLSPVFTCALYGVARVLLSPLSPVPGAVPLDPLWVFLALGGHTRARIKVPALLPGLVLGDMMAALPWPVILLRAVGMMGLAWIKPGGGFHHRYFSFMTQHALWSAVMSDWLGDYPLGHLYLVWVIQGTLWWGLTAPAQGGGKLRPFVPLVWVPAGVGVLHLLFPAPGLWPMPRLGSQSGLWLRVGASVMLLIPLAVAGVQHYRHWKRAGKPKPDWSNLLQ